MRGEYLGKGSGRYGKGRDTAPEPVSTGGRGEHFRRRRTLAEEPMRENPPREREKKGEK